ncbi:hypothetical protein [Deinococcus yunweiensis]|uniref:hypothetical protein n=1 Tax=Deinococcus yunweiensis TaxID=367282 RepID=UPI00398ED2BA
MPDLPDADAFRRTSAPDYSFATRYKAVRDRVFAEVLLDFSKGWEESRKVSLMDNDVKSALIEEFIKKGYFIRHSEVIDLRYKSGVRAYDGFYVSLHEPRQYVIERQIREENEKKMSEKLEQDRKVQNEKLEPLRKKLNLRENYTQDEWDAANIKDMQNDLLVGCWGFFKGPLIFSAVISFIYWIYLASIGALP